MRQSRGFQARHRTGPLTQAFDLDPVFIATFKHHLQPHADTQNRAASRQAPLYHLGETSRPQSLHHRGKRSYSGNDQTIGEHHLVLVGTEDGLGSHTFQGVSHRADIT